MNQNLVVDSDDPSKPIPAQYQFAMQSVGNQSLAVFSTDGPEPQGNLHILKLVKIYSEDYLN